MTFCIQNICIFLYAKSHVLYQGFVSSKLRAFLCSAVSTREILG